MEVAVQSTKRSLAFAAPEIQDIHWGELQERLADIIVTAIEKVSNSRTNEENSENC